MNVIFKSSFLKDVHRIKERALAVRLKEVIESVERVATLQEITNLKPRPGTIAFVLGITA